MRARGLALALALSVGCASTGSQARDEEAYKLRLKVDVTSNGEVVKSCRRVQGVDIQNAPCAYLLVSSQRISSMDCARFWTVKLGGDTLLVNGNAGDAYVCKAPLMEPLSGFGTASK